jgi:hypothetical protein
MVQKLTNLQYTKTECSNTSESFAADQIEEAYQLLDLSLPKVGNQNKVIVLDCKSSMILQEENTKKHL